MLKFTIAIFFKNSAPSGGVISTSSSKIALVFGNHNDRAPYDIYNNKVTFFGGFIQAHTVEATIYTPIVSEQSILCSTRGAARDSYNCRRITGITA